jgi:hypothetical protein
MIAVLWILLVAIIIASAVLIPLVFVRLLPRLVRLVLDENGRTWMERWAERRVSDVERWLRHEITCLEQRVWRYERAGLPERAVARSRQRLQRLSALQVKLEQSRYYHGGRGQ